MSQYRPTGGEPVTIDPELVRSRIETFWGYGSLEAPTWFVGMEEGLGSDGISHIQERFLAAHGKATVDMRRGMEGVVDHSRWFKAGARIQSTWKYPIALYLYLKNGHTPSTEEIRECQAFRLGNSEQKETVAIELMPLPASRADEETWLYGDLDVPSLSTRAEYLRAYKPMRVQKLRELFHTHQPSLAIFYSLTYLPDWTAVIGEQPQQITKGMYFARTNYTSCLIIPQGAARGMSYARLYEFAEKVRETTRVS